MVERVVRLPVGDRSPEARLLYGADVRESLRRLPEASVHTICTSPPFWGLRLYGTAPQTWSDGWEGEFGQEPTPERYTAHLVEVFREIKRVLRPDGTAWLNLGDSYAGGGRAGSNPEYHAKHTMFGKTSDEGEFGKFGLPQPVPEGLKSKDLVMIPFRAALALQADGWYVRNDIVWAKGNVMPESVRDRCTRSHEYLFLLAHPDSGGKYYYDADAIREGAAQPDRVRGDHFGGASWEGRQQHSEGGLFTGSPTRNKRTVWNVNPKGYAGAHFACVDSETECLTLGGWRRYNELRVGEKIFSYNMETQKLNLEPLLEVAIYEYTGDLVSVFGRSSNMLLTPNHRCVVHRRDKQGGIRSPCFVRADQLRGGMKFPVAAPLDETLLMSCSESAEFYELIGWVQSDGQFTEDGSVLIWQSQSSNPENCQRITALLTVLGAEFSVREAERSWKKTNRHPQGDAQVCWTIHGNFRTRIRHAIPDLSRIPEHFLLLPTTHVRAFLDGFLGGDGHSRKDDGRRSVIQKNKQPLDMIQIMYIRLGKSCVLTQRSKGCWTAFVTEANCRYFKNSTSALIRQDYHYHGNVWCPVVGNGTWVARRGGRPFITGNTWPEELVEPMILAGTSAHGCCPTCGAPWARVTERAKVPEHQDYEGKHLATSPHAGGRRILAATKAWRKLGLPHDNPNPAPVTVGWEPTCDCPNNDASARPVVLDTFSGSATTGAVALRLGRNYIGTDLNEGYLPLAEARIENRVPPDPKAGEIEEGSALDVFGVDG